MAIYCLAAVAGLLTSTPAGVLRSMGKAPPGARCSPERGGCEESERRREEGPVLGAPERHPCDWVETCQFPCAREDDACCHAEWDCPPDPNMPRC